MDNKVGQNDKQKNVAEEEVAPSRNVRGSALVENQVEGEKKDSTAGNTSLSIAATTSTQKHAVIGDTNQSSTAELEAKATSSLESQKEQQTALQSTHTLTSQSTSKSMPTTSSNSYQSNTMSFKPEHSNSQFHTPYSDTEVDQKTISPEIIEDSNTTLRLTEMEGSSSSVGPGQPNASSNTNAVPKKIIRIDRDYSNGELCQFQTAFPLEIEERVNPRRFQQTIDTLNEMLVKAYNPRHSMFDNCLACLTIYTSTLCLRSHFDRTMEEVRKFLDNENITLYNPQGLNFRDPCRNSFLFIELELY